MAADSGCSVKLIVGLGNPGAEYANSRHNAGFMVIERLLAGFPEGRFTESHTAESRVFTGRYRGKNLVLQMPLTYMNVSGSAVAPLSRRLGIEAPEIVVISDDINLDIGKLRIRPGGSAGGQNGLKDIIACLGSDAFPRVRVGVGMKPHPDYDLAAWVLSKFSDADMKVMDKAFEDAADAAAWIAKGDITKAMNLYSKK